MNNTATLLGGLVIGVDDNSDCPLVGEIQDVDPDGEQVHVAWGHENREAGITRVEALDELAPWRP
ncbi:MAG TPA: hypothetical protein VK942_13165 [Actinomycetes bacterium]|nr:hypothetical protein [Actinomycetes bacterium]